MAGAMEEPEAVLPAVLVPAEVEPPSALIESPLDVLPLLRATTTTTTSPFVSPPTGGGAPAPPGTSSGAGQVTAAAAAAAEPGEAAAATAAAELASRVAALGLLWQDVSRKAVVAAAHVALGEPVEEAVEVAEAVAAGRGNGGGQEGQ